MKDNLAFSKGMSLVTQSAKKLLSLWADLGLKLLTEVGA